MPRALHRLDGGEGRNAHLDRLSRHVRRQQVKRVDHGAPKSFPLWLETRVDRLDDGSRACRSQYADVLRAAPGLQAKSVTLRGGGGKQALRIESSWRHQHDASRSRGSAHRSGLEGCRRSCHELPG